MKILRLWAMAAMAMMLAACTDGQKQANGALQGRGEEAGTGSKAEAVLEGNTLTYGEHRFTFEDGLTLDGDLPGVNADGQEATLTFTHFPASVAEFKALQQQLMGRSHAGCLALNLLAYEMFRRDRAAGEECIALCNTPANASATLRMLKEKFAKTRGDASDADTYHQPYLVASFLEGATQTNKYQPNYPYVLRFHWVTDPYSKQHERSDILYGYIYRLYTTRNGDQRREASVIVPDDEEFILAHNCANFYVAVANIKNWDDTLK